MYIFFVVTNFVKFSSGDPSLALSRIVAMLQNTFDEDGSYGNDDDEGSSSHLRIKTLSDIPPVLAKFRAFQVQHRALEKAVQSYLGIEDKKLGCCEVKPRHKHYFLLCSLPVLLVE
jgi:hypothetical protein